MNTTEKLRALVEDCLASPGDTAMIAPMLKATVVVLRDDELRKAAGGPTIANLGDAVHKMDPFVYNE